jgi:hypothetical protein
MLLHKRRAGQQLGHSGVDGHGAIQQDCGQGPRSCRVLVNPSTDGSWTILIWPHHFLAADGQYDAGSSTGVGVCVVCASLQCRVHSEK